MIHRQFSFVRKRHLNRLACILSIVLWTWTGSARADGPAPLDMAQAEQEVAESYSGAHPEVQEYVLHTARTFGRSGLWLNEQAYDELSDDEQEALVNHIATLLNDGEYGRHLCHGLARASALKDERLVPGLMQVAGYHDPENDYDCRPKWMAIAALARQESEAAVPLLISLVDHGNQNTRFWARAALARQAGDDFGTDKAAWADWWTEQGHEPIEPSRLEPFVVPGGN